MSGTSATVQHVVKLQPSKLGEWRRRAAPALEADDPLKLIEKALLAGGYGGDTRPAILTYLALTTRLLGMREGAMPAHLVLVGPTSAGKSYTVGAVLRLFPKTAYVLIPAGSSHALIYGDDDLRHRGLVFGEADSLPAGEDNPAASAIRNLLQDHRLHYDVTAWDGGRRTVRTIERPGPTVLITTSTRRLRPQMDSRLFSIDVPDDQKQVRAALRAQARLEREGAPKRPKDLVAYQCLLQAAAPWDVAVPFVDELAETIGRFPAESRVTRDFARLVALIKAVAIVRLRRRHMNSRGQLEATLEDYRVVYRLVREVYASSVTGVSKRIRAVVDAVAALQQMAGEKPVTETLVASHLKTNKMTISRYVHGALTGGWLINDDPSPYRYDLRVGEPLPDVGGLPRPESLME